MAEIGKYDSNHLLIGGQIDRMVLANNLASVGFYYDIESPKNYEIGLFHNIRYCNCLLPPVIPGVTLEIRSQRLKFDRNCS